MGQTECESRAGEINGDGKARVECACTAGDPARGLELAEKKK